MLLWGTAVPGPREHPRAEPEALHYLTIWEVLLVGKLWRMGRNTVFSSCWAAPARREGLAKNLAAECVTSLSILTCILGTNGVYTEISIPGGAPETFMAAPGTRAGAVCALTR